ncbi:transposase [Bacteroides acidifaciens]|uniref:transposase n=1 Tax=Bacteroides acidifaciens TaxID=85831 RepID=UPI0030151E78
MCHYQKPKILQEYNVTAIDASDVYTKGAVKQAWHLHYALDLFSLNCQQYKITDEKTGETLKNFEIRKKESKKQIKISDDTKFSHHYMFVATSLPETFTAEDILAIYHLRWQVEMVFKRYKSILGSGSVPVKTKEATEAWINGKMMLVLLIGKFIGSVDFSPSGKSRKKQEHMERNQTGISVNFYSYHAKN